MRDKRRTSPVGSSRLLPALFLAAITTGCSFPTTQIETRHASYIANSNAHAMCETPDDGILSSVVRVATDDGADASGVIVAADRVLTAAHVVIDADLSLVRVHGEYRKARLLAVDPGNDLALLAVDTGSLRPVRLTHDDLFDYEQVWAVGYPLALDQVTTQGYFRNEVEGRLFTSAPIEAGASGGGLVRCRDGQFELAGIIRGYGGYWSEGELIPLHNLSIHTPATRIQNFVMRTDGTVL
ncbi:MAG: serine protease [Gammaproteobacteria bacterium]|nr:serine protease [Gammaproteobacteria bacterium]NNF62342.1 trypsin-like peptidase domain-containing protein [Gammaproteobacteria bacterium]NNM21341.1 trypsin-like peptidase domain-containing protein [Gammaproteobacteria bacterium]